MKRAPSLDEHVLNGENWIVGFLGPLASTFTLAWLASHRGRLRSIVLGTKRLTILVSYDTKGGEDADRSGEVLDAIYTLVYGQPPERSFADDPEPEDPE